MFSTFFSKFGIGKKKNGELEEDKTFLEIETQELPIHGIDVNILKEMKKDQKYCVIFFNGTFSPVHPGHLDSMVCAKKELEANNV